jgi:DNA polymerase-3 subunit gamma/tau
VLEEVKRKRRFTWILLSQNAHVTDVRDGTLLLAMGNVGARDSFGKGGSEDVLREALVVVLGVDLKLQTMVDSGTHVPAASARIEPSDRFGLSSGSPAVATGEDSVHADKSAEPPPPSPVAVPTPAVPDPAVRQQARDQIHPTRHGPGREEPVDDRDAVAARDDSDADEADESHADLLARHLGAEIITEEEHGA